MLHGALCLCTADPLIGPHHIGPGPGPGPGLGLGLGLGL